MKSLHARHEALSDTTLQLRVLNGADSAKTDFPRFEDRVSEIGIGPLRPTGIEIFQVNVGYMCNQACSHCHVDAGPDRKEIMTRETMQRCLDALDRSDIPTVDITGGAPELNPEFRWFVEQLSEREKHVMVRCNLTIILSNKKYHDLPRFFKEHEVEVVASLPYYSAIRTDGQRGEGVFSSSIAALGMLNAVGYGQEGSGLTLNLVYNPTGAFLPGSQVELEADFKRQLRGRYGIEFNNLFVITNMPINRFLHYLIRSGNYEAYMAKLVNAFNPEAALNVMCRNTISVGWDGRLYDCDFNQMLGLEVEQGSPRHVRDFNVSELNRRDIVLNQHCYGCTAGSGSSCGGAIT
jgi:radical SAM/Cys-rich protein